MKWLLRIALIVGIPFALAFFARDMIDGARLDQGISWLRDRVDRLAPTLPAPARKKTAPQPRTKAGHKTATKLQHKELKKPLPSPAPQVLSASEARHLPVAIRDQRQGGAPMEKLDQSDRDRLSAIIDAKIGSKTAN